MTFELDSMTKVRVLDVRTLAAKDRKPDEPPGAQLLLQANLPSSILAMFDGALPGWLYRKASSVKQVALDGMEGVERTSIGEHVKRIPWDYEQTSPEAAWPFPTGRKADTEKPPQSVTTEVVIETSRPGTRTARGRDKTKQALAAGAKANGAVQ